MSDIRRYDDPGIGSAISKLEGAGKDGLDVAATKIMIDNIDMETAFGGMGIDLDGSTKPVLALTFILDASGSMNEAKNLVCRCTEKMTHTLAQYDSDVEIVSSIWAFEDKKTILQNFRRVKENIQGPLKKYRDINGGTALYDTVLAGLTGQTLFTQDVWNHNRNIGNIVIMFSDGGDNSSKKDPDGTNTKRLAESLIEQGGYTLAYVGFVASGAEALSAEGTRILADKVGFNEVICVDKSDSEIAAIFERIANSIIKVAQSPGLVRVGDFFS